MATYTLINKTVLASTTSTVTFSSIPNTYTDLLIKTSVRINNGQQTGISQMRFNNVSTGSQYSSTGSYYNGSTATTFALANDNAIRSSNNANGDSSTSNSFTFGEYYIPDYAGSLNKQIESVNATEANGTAYIHAVQSQFRNTAITTISFDTNSGGDFAIGSSFYLYGISNA